MGFRNGILNTLTHHNRDGLKTVEALIKKHAPRKGDIIKEGEENPNQDNYISFVAEKLGVNSNDEINLNDPKVMEEYAKAVSTFEGFQNINNEEVIKGLQLAFEQRGIPLK